MIVKAVFIVFCLQILAQAQDSGNSTDSIPYDISCYQRLPRLAGNRDGVKVDNRKWLDKNMDQLSPEYRSAAIQTCFVSNLGSPNDGQLLGHRVAVAEYKSTNSIQSSDLTWMPGIGDLSQAEGTECETYIMQPGVGLQYWELTFNSQGIQTSFFQSSEGKYFQYGVSNDNLAEQTVKYSFTPSEPMMAIWGFETSRITSLGMITYQESECRLPPSPDVIIDTPSDDNQPSEPVDDKDNATNTDNEEIINDEFPEFPDPEFEQTNDTDFRNITSNSSMLEPQTMVTTSTVEQRMNEFEVVSVTIVIVFTLVLVFGCFALWFVVNRKSERVALVDPEGVAALEASEHQRQHSEMILLDEESLPKHEEITVKHAELDPVSPKNSLHLSPKQQTAVLFTEVPEEVEQQPSNFENEIIEVKNEVISMQADSEVESSHQQEPLDEIDQVIKQEESRYRQSDEKGIQNSSKENSEIKLPQIGHQSDSASKEGKDPKLVVSPRLYDEWGNLQIKSVRSKASFIRSPKEEILLNQQTPSAALFEDLISGQGSQGTSPAKLGTKKETDSHASNQQAPQYFNAPDVISLKEYVFSDSGSSAQQENPYTRRMQYQPYQRKFRVDTTVEDQRAKSGQGRQQGQVLEIRKQSLLQNKKKEHSVPTSTRLQDNIRVQKMIYQPQAFSKVLDAVETDKNIEEAVHRELLKQSQQTSQATSQREQTMTTIMQMNANALVGQPPIDNRVIHDGKDRRTAVVRTGRFLIDSQSKQVVAEPKELSNNQSKPAQPPSNFSQYQQSSLANQLQLRSSSSGMGRNLQVQGRKASTEQNE